MPIDLYRQFLLQEYQLPKEWVWHFAETIGEDGKGRRFFHFKGCVPSTFKSGPRKGKANVKKPVPGTFRDLIVHEDKIHDFTKKWELETGCCSRCWGAPSIAAPCKKCGGLSKPPPEAIP